MRSRRTIGTLGTMLAAGVLLGALLPPATGAQSPAASPAGLTAADCGIAASLRFPIHDPGAILLVPFAFEDPAEPNPDPGFAGRFHPDETWTLPEDAAGSPVFAAGPGLVVASGTIGVGDQGGIVVVEHAGPFTLPASLPDDPYVHDATDTDTLLTVYAGIDPMVTAGECVSPDSVIGGITAACAAGVTPPCSDLPAALRLGVRLGSTADPALRSADWSVAGPAADSIGGTFPDPQVMVDDGVREPSRVIVALAAPCPSPAPDAPDAPDASPGPDGTGGPCGPATPTGTPAPSLVPSAPPTPAPTPSPTPKPTPRPVVSPQTALLQGIPASLRGSCEKRTSRLVTGTLAAVDCRPDDPAIALMTYFLASPADARFTFSSRAKDAGLGGGGDCAGAVPGVESRDPAGSVLCYKDADGKANLRFAVTEACPAVYVGVLGSGRDIGRLWSAVDAATGGEVWAAPRGTIAACKGDKGEKGAVSTPPTPTNAHLKQALVRKPTNADPLPPTRVTFSWSEPVTADTTIEVWGIRDCLKKPPKDGSAPCIDGSTRIPGSQLVLLRTAPAGDGSVSWQVPTQEITAGYSYHDEQHGWIASVVLRASNAKAHSRFALIPEALGVGCDGCTY
ncbi:MAG: hypothetical protein U0869_00695 [Chloroflexota bacterium]